MKRIFAGALATFIVLSASAATLTPIQLLNPAGSTSGQVITSTGASSAPSWSSVSAGTLAPIAGNTVIGNATASSTAPSALAVPSCSGTNNALLWTANSGFACGANRALTTGNLSQFATTTSAQLLGIISDETGTGSLVFGTSPTLTTPLISSIVNTGTLTLPTSTDTLVGRATTDTLTNKTLTSPSINGGTISGGTINSASVGATTPSTGSFTTLAASGTVSGTGITNLFASPPTIGSVAAAPGFFTNLTASGTVGGSGIASLFASPPAIGSTAPAAGAFTTLTVTGAITPSQTAGIVGTTTNNSASAGSVGEFICAQVTNGGSPTGCATNSSTPVSLTSNTPANVTSVSLTAGEWNCTANVVFNNGGTTVTTQSTGSISTTSATMDTLQFANYSPPNTAGLNPAFPVPKRRFLLSATTTIYLVVNNVFATSTSAAYGRIECQRPR